MFGETTVSVTEQKKSSTYVFNIKHCGNSYKISYDYSVTLNLTPRTRLLSPVHLGLDLDAVSDYLIALAGITYKKKRAREAMRAAIEQHVPSTFTLEPTSA